MKKEEFEGKVILTMSPDEWKALSSGIRNAWDLLASSFFRRPLPTSASGQALSPPNRNQVSLLDSEESWQAWANRQINGLNLKIDEIYKVRGEFQSFGADNFFDQIFAWLKVQDETIGKLLDRIQGLDQADARKGDRLGQLVDSQNDWTTQFGERLVEMNRRLTALEGDEVPMELEEIPHLKDKVEHIENQWSKTVTDLKERMARIESPRPVEQREEDTIQQVGAPWANDEFSSPVGGRQTDEDRGDSSI